MDTLFAVFANPRSDVALIVQPFANLFARCGCNDFHDIGTGTCNAWLKVNKGTVWHTVLNLPEIARDCSATYLQVRMW